jgi:Hypothetical glycosyl hydrolase family 15
MLLTPPSAPARAVIVIVCMLLALALPARALGDPPGEVHYAKSAGSSFDQFTWDPSSRQQTWMRDHYWRMRAYTPYFDSRTSWFDDAWFYKDSYAIYVGEDLAKQHPDWILRDSRGSKLYIPYGCGGGSCPQYAADIGNWHFRQRWIEDAKASLAQGYKGIFVDDVNMGMQVGDGDGNLVPPIDPRTGRAMTAGAWRYYMARFMVGIRRALPDAEIVHNSLWFEGDTTRWVKQSLAAANIIEIERGFEDGGITGGDGHYGIETLFKFIDDRHADGQGVVLDGESDGTADHLYGLAGYLLVSDGRDSLNDATGGTPSDWWSAGYDHNLGSALNSRHLDASGVWRRDFAGGVALLNEPGAPTRTVALAAGLHDLNGTPRSSVTLGPASGAVLLR